MTKGTTTVGQFLLGSSRKHVKRSLGTEPVTTLKRALAERAAPIPWPGVLKTVEEKVREALDINFEDVLVSTWVRSAALAKYLDPSRYPPDQTILAQLAEQTIKASFRPSVEVLVNEQLVGTIPLDVSVSVLVKGGILTIRGGKILELKTGTCQAKGKVAIAGVTLAEKKLQPIELPGQICFEEGKEIEASPQVA